jgi:DUF1680 family protein
METSQVAPDGLVARSVPTGPRKGPVSPTGSAIGRFSPLGLGEVVLAAGSELGSWQRRNRTQTLPHCIEQLHESGAVRNLQRVALGGYSDVPHEGMPFSDSDVYKVLEAAAWDSSTAALSDRTASFVDEASDLIARAQRQDGYLNSRIQGQHPELAWKDLRWGHELYCAGHLLQAAVASSRSGSSTNLLGVSNRLLEHLLTTFSLEDGDGRLVGVCGHPQVETALVEFYRLTGDSRALQLARRQVDLRGRADVALPTVGSGAGRFPLTYFLHHIPVRQRTSAIGHAVRELYFQAGVVDVGVESQDTELLAASERIWEDLFRTKTYVTGAHGSRHRDEAIGDPYELPSDRAYGETCAGIASFQWNWRLLLATGRARYADAMEQVLWNTIAGSVSRQGTEFYYSNTLHLRTGHDGADEDAPVHRLSWYHCACCPPNLARLVASINAYLCTRDPSGLQLQMPFSGTVSTTVPGGTVDLTVHSGHPWDGTTNVEVKGCTSTEPWELSARLPDWARREDTRVTVDGLPVQAQWDGSYLKIRRRWSSGDRVEVVHSMRTTVLTPHWKVDAVRGSVAVQRGPLVYCVEADDLETGTTVEDIALDATKPLEATGVVPTSLEGYVKVAIRAVGRKVGHIAGTLYGDDGESSYITEPLSLTFVPYFARGNRSSGAMRVWVPSAYPEHGPAGDEQT